MKGNGKMTKKLLGIGITALIALVAVAVAIRYVKFYRKMAGFAEE